jgi:ParB family chromosome partitioning protein
MNVTNDASHGKQTRRALGRGLDALFPSAPSAPADGGALEIPVDEVVPNAAQPRRHFDEESLGTLADSIRRHGLLQPIVVRRAAQGYELIAGERRLRAAIRAGLATVPALVRAADPEQRLELALIENLQREALSPLEEAEAYRHLVDDFGLTQDDVARQVGKSRPAVANALRLLGLPEAVKVRLESGELSAGHARAVLAVEGADAQVRFARDIVERKLSKNDAERVASAGGRGRPPARKAPPGDLHLRAVAEELTRGLGTRVRISRRARGGVVEIEFYSDGELDRIVVQLRAAAAPRS